MTRSPITVELPRFELYQRTFGVRPEEAIAIAERPERHDTFGPELGGWRLCLGPRRANHAHKILTVGAIHPFTQQETIWQAWPVRAEWCVGVALKDVLRRLAETFGLDVRVGPTTQPFEERERSKFVFDRFYEGTNTLAVDTLVHPKGFAISPTRYGNFDTIRGGTRLVVAYAIDYDAVNDDLLETGPVKH